MVGPSSTSGRQLRPLGWTREPRLPSRPIWRRGVEASATDRVRAALHERLPSLFFGFADVVTGCPVYVHGAGWPSGADASGFGNTGRGEPVGGGGFLPGPAEVFQERPVEPELGVSDDQDPGPAVRRPGEYGASEWSSPGSALRSERCAPGRSGGEAPARIGPHRPEWRQSWRTTAHRQGSTVPPVRPSGRRPPCGPRLHPGAPGTPWRRRSGPM